MYKPIVHALLVAAGDVDGVIGEISIDVTEEFRSPFRENADAEVATVARTGQLLSRAYLQTAGLRDEVCS